MLKKKLQKSPPPGRERRTSRSSCRDFGSELEEEMLWRREDFFISLFALTLFFCSLQVVSLSLCFCGCSAFLRPAGRVNKFYGGTVNFSPLSLLSLLTQKNFTLFLPCPVSFRRITQSRVSLFAPCIYKSSCFLRFQTNSKPALSTGCNSPRHLIAFRPHSYFLPFVPRVCPCFVYRY